MRVEREEGGMQGRAQVLAGSILEKRFWEGSVGVKVG